MDSKIIAGRIGSFPAFATVTNLSSGDITQIIGATTGLVKTLGKYALVGGLASIGIGAILLAILMGGMAPADKPTIPIGCTPNFIRTKKRSFWGIVLDDELEFETEGNSLKVPFERISAFRIGILKRFTLHDAEISLVDGSNFKNVTLVSPKELQVATLAGVQKIPFNLYPDSEKKYGQAYYLDDVVFQSPTITEAEQLRDRLQRALDQNADAITKLIGPDVLKQFFNVSSI